MSKPHIDLMNRGVGPSSIDYTNNPLKELLSTCPCDSCLDLYRKIHGKDSPMEYREPTQEQKSTELATTSDPTAVYNSWQCPPTQAYPDAATLEIIRRAPWKLGQVHHGTPEHPIDIDSEGNFYLKGSMEHHFRQFTDMSNE